MIWEANGVKLRGFRVLLGGLLAGVIINVFEFVAKMGAVLAGGLGGNDYGTRLEHSPLSSTAGVIFLLSGFLCGIGAIWALPRSSSAFRPQAWKTAVLTGSHSGSSPPCYGVSMMLVWATPFCIHRVSSLFSWSVCLAASCYVSRPEPGFTRNS